MRHREMEEEIPPPIIQGYESFDMTYPYGDGPWYEPWMVCCITNGPWFSFRKTCDDELHHGPPWKDGGPLDILEFHTDQYEVKSNLTHIGWKYIYEGGFTPSSYPSSFLDWTDPATAGSWGDVSAHGASAWNKFAPTKPEVDLGTFIGELKEVPRMFQTTAKGFSDLWRTMGGSPTGFGPKGVSNHWLNTQFGWIPFLNDLRDFYKTCVYLDKQIKQLRRDNGQWIRRRGTVLDESSETVLVDDEDNISMLPSLVSYHNKRFVESGYPYGTKRVIETRSQRIWFSGAYRYWIPGNDESFLWKGKAIAMLFGLNPSPALVWNLTPWSWLIDWCSNTGDVISNISLISQNNLCSKYAYLMGTSKQRIDFEATRFLQNATPKASWFAEITRKQRIEASPFGFSLSSDDFTARQWSILSALGITRLSRS